MRTLRLGMMSIGMVIAVSGCTTLGSYKTPGCEVTYVSGTEWSIAGVNLPIKALNDVKIGSVVYKGQQAQKLSDTAQVLDMARQGNCSILYAPGFSTMPDIYRAKVYDRMAASNSLLQDFGRRLLQANTPEEGQNAAEQKLEQSKDIQPPKVTGSEGPTPPTPPVSFVDPVARERVATLQSAVDELSTGLKQLRDAGPVRLQVLGFESNSTELKADRRQGLMSKFRVALSRIPPGRIPNVLLIGYADSNGAHVYNVSLALRRAEAVALLLRGQHLGRDFHTEVTSGGILSQGTSDEARKVEIRVS